MIQKFKILKAINEGIKAGFKLNQDNDQIDNSQIIDFSDSKIKTSESMNVDKLNKNFKEFIDNEEWDSVFKYVNIYGTTILYEKYEVAFSLTDFHEFINFLVNTYGPNINLNWISVKNMTNLTYLFGYSSFNGDISEWDVSNVTEMNDMFLRSKFNGDISKWNVSNVKDMNAMFQLSKFNGDISGWNVSNVENMFLMFEGSQFNGDISGWDVSNVNDMGSMFTKSFFTGNISNWDVSSVTNMSSMFASCNFNGDLSTWDISNVTDFREMFNENPNRKTLVEMLNMSNNHNITQDNFKDKCRRIAGSYVPSFLKEFVKIDKIRSKQKKLDSEENVEKIKQYVKRKTGIDITDYYKIFVNQQGNLSLTILNVINVSIVQQHIMNDTYRVYVNSIYRFKTTKADGTFIYKVLSPREGLEHRASPYKSIDKVKTVKECIDWLLDLPAFNNAWEKYPIVK